MNKNIIEKVLIIGDLFPDSFADNIFITLKEMGYIVDVLPSNPLTNINKAYIRMLGSYIKRAFPVVEEFFSGKLIKKIVGFGPDLVIATNSGVPPGVIRRIKAETGSMAACWYTDPVANMDRQYILASPYDIFFLKDYYMVELFRRKLNKNTYYLPEACNPIWHKKMRLLEEEKKNYKCDIALAGNMYYYRAIILEQLMDYHIKIWGPVFPRWLESPAKDLFQNRYVVRDEKAKAFICAKINLNTLNPTEINGVNCRTFEIAGCGGFQIVDSKPALNELFENGKELVTFETVAELKDKVAYYLSHEDEREEIALRSYKRAHNEHTYEHRLKILINTVKDTVQKTEGGL